MKTQYTLQDLKERIEKMNEGGLVLSVQYGMVFILNQDNEILLCLSDLVDPDEARNVS